MYQNSHDYDQELRYAELHRTNLVDFVIYESPNFRELDTI